LPAFPKVSFEETLEKYVLPSACIGCASCAVVCPFNCLDYINEKPALVKECKSCGICAQVCPRYGVSLPALEKLVFGRERKADEDFGIYRRMVIAQTKDETIMRACQDGGVVTTLLVHALEKGLIDGAVVSGVVEENPLRPVPKLATTRADIVGSAGTRYSYSPNMLALGEGIQQKRKGLALVGTPCQMHAIRRVEAIPLRKYSDALSFAVGVFCSECFAYDAFVGELIQGKLGINPLEVKKVNIKGKLVVTAKSGAVATVPLQEAKKYASKCVKKCPDFSAELADISAGGLGLDGWTLTILRTQKGEDLFREVESAGLLATRPAEEDKRVLDLLVGLSARKRETATALEL